MADGLLLTRRDRFVLFWAKLGAACAAPLLLVLFAVLTNGVAVAVACAALGGLVAVCVATSVRTVRGAAWAGLVTAAGLLLLNLALAWFLSHPILPN
jgi:hypothetical protein